MESSIAEFLARQSASEQLPRSYISLSQPPSSTGLFSLSAAVPFPRSRCLRLTCPGRFASKLINQSQRRFHPERILLRFVKRAVTGGSTVMLMLSAGSSLSRASFPVLFLLCLRAAPC